MHHQIIHHTPQNHWKSFQTKVSNIFFCLSLKNVRYSLGVCQQFKSKIQVLLFTSRPFARQWSLISFVTSKPSARQWSSISLYQDPLRGNDHWFLMSNRGSLRDNGHRSPYIKTLCKAMVIDFLCHIEALYEAMVIDLFKSPSARQWSLISFVRWWPSTW